MVHLTCGLLLIRKHFAYSIEDRYILLLKKTIKVLLILALFNLAMHSLQLFLATDY